MEWGGGASNRPYRQSGLCIHSESHLRVDGVVTRVENLGGAVREKILVSCHVAAVDLAVVNIVAIKQALKIVVARLPQRAAQQQARAGLDDDEKAGAMSPRHVRH